MYQTSKGNKIELCLNTKIDRKYIKELNILFQYNSIEI